MRRKARKFYRTLRRPLEWCAIFLAQSLIPRVPLHRLLSLSRRLADITYAFDRRGRAIAQANLRLMFGPRLTPLRSRAIVRGSYRNMSRVLFNVFWTARDTRTRMAAQVIFDPRVLDTLRKNLPAITVSAHFGNWELLSQACVTQGIPMMSVAKELGSPEMTERLMRLRSTIGQQIVPANGALRHLLHALKHGTSVGLLIDQHTHLWDGGTWVSLFGVPAGISLAPALLARRVNRPILFAWSRPLKDGRYRIEPGQLFLPDPHLSDTELTQQLTHAFERVIRRHPSLWCLNYRRWRYIRPGDDPASYPFYARPSRLSRDKAAGRTTPPTL